MARNIRREPAPNPSGELIQLAIDLDLTALARSLPALLERAENHSPSFTDFGLQMFRAEVNARKTRRLERSLKRCHLGAVEGLEGFDFAARPKLDPRVVKELLGCRFVAEHRNILCVGRAGLGKTRVAKAIAHAACLAGYSVLCVLAADMIEELHGSHADGTFKRAFRRYVKPELLPIEECISTLQLRGQQLSVPSRFGQASAGFHCAISYLEYQSVLQSTLRPSGSERADREEGGTVAGPVDRQGIRWVRLWRRTEAHQTYIAWASFTPCPSSTPQAHPLSCHPAPVY